MLKIIERQAFAFDIATELRTAANELGFLSAIYFIDIEHEVLSIDVKRERREYRKLKSLILTDNNVGRYCDEYWKRYVNVDPYFILSKKSDFYIWPYETGGYRGETILKMMKEYKFNSKMTLNFPLYNTPNIKGCFVLLSSYSEEMLRNTMADRNKEVIRRLKEFHMQAIDECAEWIFPYEELGIVSNKSRLILQLISEGYTRAKVSEKLYISERGVDYHIDKLKMSLNCSNVTSLIGKAIRLKIIT